MRLPSFALQNASWPLVIIPQSAGMVGLFALKFINSPALPLLSMPM
jgi:hypothetical protein